MTDQQNLSPRAWLELMALALIWGGSFLAIATALDQIGPLWVIAHRTGWAALILLVVLHLSGGRLPAAPGLLLACLVMGVLNNVIPFGLQAFAQLHVASGLVAILNATTAFFGVLLAAAVFADERLTRNRIIGVLLGMFGVALAIGLTALQSLDLRSLAQWAVIGSTLSYACAAIWARRFLTGLRPVQAATGMLCGSALVSIPMAWAVEGPPVLALAPATWAGIAYFAVAATALAYLLYYRVLAMAGSGNLMLVTLLVPPVAIALGVWFRDEVFATADLAGFALIALGMVVLDGRVVTWIAARARR